MCFAWVGNPQSECHMRGCWSTNKGVQWYIPTVTIWRLPKQTVFCLMIPKIEQFKGVQWYISTVTWWLPRAIFEWKIPMKWWNIPMTYSNDIYGIYSNNIFQWHIPMTCSKWYIPIKCSNGIYQWSVLIKFPNEIFPKQYSNRLRLKS